jgi:NAD(P)-dependent dehydrogenase (short-subunit alcohol dehydrogenase family)
VSDEPTTLIVGAANAIGSSLALRLASRPGNVCLAGETEPALRDIATSAGLSDVNSSIHALEARDRGAIESMCSHIIDRFGDITFLFFDSEIARPGGISDLSLTDWQAVLDGRLTAAFHLCQVVIPYMMQRKHGGIVFNGSDVAVAGLHRDASDVVSHAALYSFAKALALEFAPHGIRANAVAPGAVDVRSSRTDDGEGSATNAAAIPMLRLGRPEEVAAVADFLLSDRASYITGQMIQVNGGRNTW